MLNDKHLFLITKNFIKSLNNIYFWYLCINATYRSLIFKHHQLTSKIFVTKHKITYFMNVVVQSVIHEIYLWVSFFFK